MAVFLPRELCGDFGITQLAGQNSGYNFRDCTTECHIQQMTCIAMRDRRGAGAFERRTRNPESLAVVSMQLHLDF